MALKLTGIGRYPIRYNGKEVVLKLGQEVPSDVPAALVEELSKLSRKRSGRMVPIQYFTDEDVPAAAPAKRSTPAKVVSYSHMQESINESKQEDPYVEEVAALLAEDAPVVSSNENLISLKHLQTSVYESKLAKEAPAEEEELLQGAPVVSPTDDTAPADNSEADSDGDGYDDDEAPVVVDEEEAPVVVDEEVPVAPKQAAKKSSKKSGSKKSSK
jgi:hypothetical protein